MSSLQAPCKKAYCWKCSINCLRFVDDLVLLVSTERSLQHAIDRFAVACDQSGMKISTEKDDV